MLFEMDFARRFRESADLMRAIAAGETNIHASGILDRIAAEYDRTASELELLHSTHSDGVLTPNTVLAASAHPPAEVAAPSVRAA